MNSQIQKKLRRQGHDFVDREEVRSTERSNAEKPFFKWYWENVLGYSSEEYYREYWREVHRGHTIGSKPKVFRGDFPSLATIGNVYDGLDDTLLRFIIGTIPAIFYYLIRHSIRRYIQRLQRPTYYERECERRIELGRQRRSITLRTTKNSKPTFDEIRAAWNGARHSPEGALKLGGMLEDLECYVNNHTIGNAVEGYRGRRGGIKRLLQDKAPDLFEHYAALMRYKSIARRFRQACGLVDPYPASAVLPMSSPPRLTAAASKTQASITSSERGNGKSCSEQIKRNDDTGFSVRQVAMVGDMVSNAQGVLDRLEITSEKQQKNEGKDRSVTDSVNTREPGGLKSPGSGGVKSWVLDGFVFAFNGYWVEREAYEAAVRVLKSCENSVISLEAAVALEIDPDCVTRIFSGSKVSKSGCTKKETSTNNWAQNQQRQGRSDWKAVIGGEYVGKIVPGESAVSKSESGIENSVPNKSSDGEDMVLAKLGGIGGSVSRRVSEWLVRRRTVA